VDECKPVLYGNPRIYELAFGFRDFVSEVEFLQELAGAYTPPLLTST